MLLQYELEGNGIKYERIGGRRASFTIKRSQELYLIHLKGHLYHKKCSIFLIKVTYYKNHTHLLQYVFNLVTLTPFHISIIFLSSSILLFVLKY